MAVSLAPRDWCWAGPPSTLPPLVPGDAPRPGECLLYRTSYTAHLWGTGNGTHWAQNRHVGTGSHKQGAGDRQLLRWLTHRFWQKPRHRAVAQAGLTAPTTPSSAQEPAALLRVGV